jgi:hypothetical protein
MSILTDDQLARIRFAYRVYSTGNSYGAPAAAVSSALDLVDKVVEAEGVAYSISPEAFAAHAKRILSKLEN